jgi:hypothetical protein
VGGVPPRGLFACRNRAGGAPRERAARGTDSALACYVACLPRADHHPVPAPPTARLSCRLLARTAARKSAPPINAAGGGFGISLGREGRVAESFAALNRARHPGRVQAVRRLRNQHAAEARPASPAAIAARGAGSTLPSAGPA